MASGMARIDWTSSLLTATARDREMTPPMRHREKNQNQRNKRRPRETDEDPLARLKTHSHEIFLRPGKKKPTDSGEKAGKKPTVWRDGRGTRRLRPQVTALDRSRAPMAARAAGGQGSASRRRCAARIWPMRRKAAWDEEEVAARG